MEKILVLIISLMMVSTVFAQELPGAGITPDHFLYGLDKAFERIQLFFTFDRASKTKLRLQFASERIAEANEMVRRNKPEFVQGLMAEHEKEINETENEIKALRGIGRNITDLVEHISNMTYKHILVLEEVLEKVPEKAKPAIEKAINVSKKGHDNAIEGLSEELPERAAEFAMRFAESRLEKAKEKALERRVEEAEELAEEYEEEIDKHINLTERAEGLGRNITALAEHVCNMTYKHILVLERVLLNVSEQAKSAIEHAINASMRGHENCMKRLQERISSMMREVRKTYCSVDADCRNLICPMVIGSDTPICKEGRCVCGPRWDLINRTEWRERFKEEFTTKIEESMEEIAKTYERTEIKEMMEMISPRIRS